MIGLIKKIAPLPFSSVISSNDQYCITQVKKIYLVIVPEVVVAELTIHNN